MSVQPTNEATGTLNVSSQRPQETSGVLDDRSVVNANSTHSKSNWFYIALVIGAVVGVGVVGVGVTGFFAHQGMLPAALAKLNSLGALGQAGSITMIVGGILIVGGLASVIGLVKKNQTNASAKIVSIGSTEELLDENGIRDRLKEINCGAGSIDALIIYGTGDVQLNTDPGLVRLNPKKVILVGARIVHKPGDFGLDDRLSRKNEWLSSVVRVGDVPFVEQLIISSVDEALAHTPPSRGIFKGSYHLVYQVR